MVDFALNRLPLAVRLALYVLASGVLLYLCLAPGEELPSVRLWDKAQHALAWAVLAGVGLALWPSRPIAVAAYALAFGLMVEALQGALGAGRHADMRDLGADVAGVVLALLLWQAARTAMKRA